MYTCKDCHNRYKSSSTLARHKRNHSITKTNQCKQCGTSFRRADLLKRHSRVHASSSKRDQVPLACDYCRRLKVKCDGQAPCQNCKPRARLCSYTPITERTAIGAEASARAGAGEPEVASEFGRGEDVDLESIDRVGSRADEQCSVNSDRSNRTTNSPMTALSIYNVPEIDVHSTQPRHEQQVRLASLLSFNVGCLSLTAPLASLSLIPTNNVNAAAVEAHLVDKVCEWATESQAKKAVEFACIIYSFVLKVSDTGLRDSPALSELALTCLHDSASVIWAYAGLHPTASQASPVHQRTQADGGDLPVCRENAYEILMDLALLCKDINKGASNSRSKSIWSMAVNPFAEFLHIRESAEESILT